MKSESFNNFAAKRNDLKCAQQLVTGAEFLGRTIGVLLSFLPWWLSGAPWWAIPVFAICIGWVGGRLYGSYVYRERAKVLNAKWPELKL